MTEKEFVSEAITAIGKERHVVDVGGGERFGKWLREYRDLLAQCDYKTFDYDATTGADIVGDIHNIPLEAGTVDAVICCSVLEHVRDPCRAVDEIHRILRPGGRLLVYVPSTYPYHARKGHYPDYWRFFEDTLVVLFVKFSSYRIHRQGGVFSAISLFVPHQDRLQWGLKPISRFLDRVFRADRRNTAAGYYVHAIK